MIDKLEKDIKIEMLLDLVAILLGILGWIKNDKLLLLASIFGVLDFICVIPKKLKLLKEINREKRLLKIEMLYYQKQKEKENIID